MKIAYLDLFCGLSGDMMLGALVDAGLPLKELRRGLAGLELSGYALSARRLLKGCISATQVAVRLLRSPSHSHTPLREILRRIGRSRLPPAVRERSAHVFTLLGRAEGKIHQIDPLKVSFHEVGAVDSIVDIVGSCLGLHLLGIERLHCSPVPVARGEIHSHHGTLPNPGPAATALLKGFPLIPAPVDREILTPTGAALLAGLVEEPGRFPEMTLEAVGYGAGHWDLPERPDVVRLLVGRTASPETSDLVYRIETNLDDTPGEVVGYLYEKLFAAGALDVFATPIQMKKCRPAVQLSVLVPPSSRRAVEELLLRETPALGVRRTIMERTKLERRQIRVSTPYGPIRFKEGLRSGREIKASPEYEDVRRAAEKYGIPLLHVMETAREAYRRRGPRRSRPRS